MLPPEVSPSVVESSFDEFPIVEFEKASVERAGVGVDVLFAKKKPTAFASGSGV